MKNLFENVSPERMYMMLALVLINLSIVMILLGDYVLDIDRSGTTLFTAFLFIVFLGVSCKLGYIEYCKVYRKSF